MFNLFLICQTFVMWLCECVCVCVGVHFVAVSLGQTINLFTNYINTHETTHGVCKRLPLKVVRRYRASHLAFLAVTRILTADLSSDSSTSV